jgi:hypothetical protein
MASKTAKGGLIGSAKAECANWIDPHGRKGRCIGTDTSGDVQFNSSGKCWLTEGRPCKYFERCVLGPADYKYRLPCYDYEQLFEQYAAINRAYLSKQVTVRRCECSAALKPRHRYCEDCTRKKRQETYRLTRRKRAG